MTLEEYVEVSHKYGGPYGKPAGIPNLFSKYIEPCFERDSDAKYDKKAYSLWKNADFAACYHILPRDVDILIYYWHDSCHMFGYCPGVIITENYMCKFYIYPKYSSKFEDEYLLRYEHKNGDTIDRSYPNITQLANAINDLVKFEDKYVDVTNDANAHEMSVVRNELITRSHQYSRKDSEPFANPMITLMSMNTSHNAIPDTASPSEFAKLIFLLLTGEHSMRSPMSLLLLAITVCPIPSVMKPSARYGKN